MFTQRPELNQLWDLYTVIFDVENWHLLAKIDIAKYRIAPPQSSADLGMCCLPVEQIDVFDVAKQGDDIAERKESFVAIDIMSGRVVDAAMKITL